MVKGAEPGYQGQPSFVVAGFLVMLLEPWVEVGSGDEWGEYLLALHHAADMANDYEGDDNKMISNLLLKEIYEQLEAAHDDEWSGMLPEYANAILDAQQNFESTARHWRGLAPGFKGEAALEEIIAWVPEWMREPSADVVKDAHVRDLMEQRDHLVRKMAQIDRELAAQ